MNSNRTSCSYFKKHDSKSPHIITPRFRSSNLDRFNQLKLQYLWRLVFWKDPLILINFFIFKWTCEILNFNGSIFANNNIGCLQVTMYHSKLINVFDKVSYFIDNLWQQRAICLHSGVEILMFDSITILVVEFYFLYSKKLLS